MSDTTRYFLGGIVIGVFGTTVLMYIVVMLTLAFRGRR